MSEREVPNGDCVWDDCDQAAEFCPGHALEYANVADENDAILLRHAITALETQRDALLAMLRQLGQKSAVAIYPQEWREAEALVLKVDRLIATQKAAETARRRAL